MTEPKSGVYRGLSEIRQPNNLSVLQGEEKTLVHFCCDFYIKYLPCQTSLMKHKKRTERTCFLPNAIKISHQTDFEQTTTSFTIKVIEDAEFRIQRQSSILLLESPEVGWKEEMEKGAQSQRRI